MSEKGRNELLMFGFLFNDAVFFVCFGKQNKKPNSKKSRKRDLRAEGKPKPKIFTSSFNSFTYFIDDETKKLFPRKFHDKLLIYSRLFI